MIKLDESGQPLAHTGQSMDELLRVIDEWIPLHAPLYPPLKGALVFDIGAHRGYFTRLFLACGARRVVAVEPLLACAPEIVHELLWFHGLNPSVTLVAAAIAAQPTLPFTINRFQPYLSSLDQHWMTRSRHAEYFNGNSTLKTITTCTTLDWLIAAHGMPDFIKIDAEGYDGEVIKTLSHPVNNLCFEYHQDWLVDAHSAMLHLDEIGHYTYNYTLNERHTFELSQPLSTDSLIRHLERTLEVSGPLSWGDIYASRDDRDGTSLYPGAEGD